MTSTLTSAVIELAPIPIVDNPKSSRSKNAFELSGNRLTISHEAADDLSAPEGTSTATSSPSQHLSTFHLAMTMFQLCLVNFFVSFTSGVITVGLPKIASSINLQRSLYLWPASIYSLTSGAALLIAGSVADIIGARRVEICGVCLLGVFILACGFAQTGIQLVVFRALKGIALAMHSTLR